MKATGTIDIGIALMRPLLCLGVVCCHFWSSAPSFAWHFVLPCCAPLFFLMSFYLFARRFSGVGGSYVRNRLFRLYFPLLSWAVIYYLILNLAHLTINTDVVTLKDFFFQCLTGHCYNEPMWFQFDLIVITVLFFVIAFACRNNMRIICWLFAVLSVIAFCLQYAGLNHRLFSLFDYSFKYPLGRICEMLPYAFAGMALQLADKKEKWIRVLFLFVLLLASAVLYLYHDSPQGFGYQGVRLLLLSVSVFVGMKLIDFNRLSNGMKKAILMVSKYTLGIYCLHLIMGKGIYRFMSLVSWESLYGSFLYCVIVYVCCYSLFFCIDKLIRNKYLNMIFQ